MKTKFRNRKNFLKLKLIACLGIGFLLPHMSWAKELDMLIEGAIAAKPNVIFTIDVSASMTTSVSDQANFGLLNGAFVPGEYLNPEKYIVDSSLEFFAVCDDSCPSGVTFTKINWSDIDNPGDIVISEYLDGPPTPFEISHMNQFISYFDSHLQYLGGSTGRPLKTTIGKWFPDFNWTYSDTATLLPSVAASVGPYDWIELRWNEEGIGRFNTMIDLIRENVYTAQDQGGAYIAVMVGSTNTDGYLGDTVDNDRLEPSRSPLQYPDENDNGAWPLVAFQDVSTMAQANNLSNRLYAMEPYSNYAGSPYTEMLYTAYLYFTGGTTPWNYQKLNMPSYFNDYYSRNTWSNLNAAIDTAAYTSPATDQYNSVWNANPCGKNHVIMYGDGYPSFDWQANGLIQTLTGASAPTSHPSAACSINSPTCEYNYHDTHLNETLFDEFINYLYTTDLDTSRPGIQNITTHLIDYSGLNDPGVSGVEQAIFAGGGEYIFASDLGDTRNMFVSLLEELLKIGLTGYKLAIPSDASNALKQSDDVYVSFFDAEAGWRGNLKKFKMNGGSILNGVGNPVFFPEGGIDENQVDPDQWGTALNTGDPIFSGGVAAQFDHTATKRYVQTPLGLYRINRNSGTLMGGGEPQVLMSDFGVTTGTRHDLLKLAAGVDVLDKDNDGSTNDSYPRFGDALNSEPKVFYYYRDTNNPNNSQGSVFLGTNLGFVHSFDTTSGQEQWAVIPKKYLPAMSALHDNKLGKDDPKIYGLDGGLAIYHDDKNGDFDLLNANNGGTDIGESAYLYASSRRGGELITALNITNPSNVQNLWQITSNTPGFSNLGETWSMPTVAKIQMGETDTKPVIFIGGGYDNQYDNPGSPTTAKGASIYMIDAVTGQKLWAVGSDGTGSAVSGMNYPIVSQVVTFDTDSDDTTDLFYALDIVGQIFRCDIDDLSSPSTFQIPGNSDIHCMRIANLEPSRTKRFFVDLDAALMLSDNGAITGVALAAGSGDINNPNSNASSDRFYVVFDHSPKQKPMNPTDYLNINDSDLVNASSGAVSIPSNKHGWFIDLAPGEKVFKGSETIYNHLTFQTFYLSGASIPTSCERVSKYSSNIWTVDIRDADKPINMSARFQPVKVVTAMASKPKLILNYNAATKKVVPSLLNGAGTSSTNGNALTLPEMPFSRTTNYSNEEYQ